MADIPLHFEGSTKARKHGSQYFERLSRASHSTVSRSYGHAIFPYSPWRSTRARLQTSLLTLLAILVNHMSDTGFTAHRRSLDPPEKLPEKNTDGESQLPQRKQERDRLLASSLLASSPSSSSSFLLAFPPVSRFHPQRVNWPNGEGQRGAYTQSQLTEHRRAQLRTNRTPRSRTTQESQDRSKSKQRRPALTACPCPTGRVPTFVPTFP